MRHKLGLLALILLSATAAAAQERPPGVKIDGPPGAGLETPAGKILELPSGELVRVNPEDVAGGHVLKRVAPQYPKAAKKARVEGAVVVHVMVDEKGRVMSAEATDGNPLLIPAALKAVRKWRFAPTTISGQPVRVTGNVTVNFVLD